MAETVNYDSHFRVARLASFAMTASLVLITGIGAYLTVTDANVLPGVAVDPSALQILRLVVYSIGILMLALAFALKSAIRTLRESVILRFVRGLTRSIHRQRRGGSALSILLTVSALCEGTGVLGFVLLLVSGGSDPAATPLLAAGLVSLVVTLPKPADRDNLVKIDTEVRDGR